eukprot:8771743-Pyramimonas_sp.AAC.1
MSPRDARPAQMAAGRAQGSAGSARGRGRLRRCQERQGHRLLRGRPIPGWRGGAHRDDLTVATHKGVVYELDIAALPREVRAMHVAKSFPVGAAIGPQRPTPDFAS